jgi:hypothetical protein
MADEKVISLNGLDKAEVLAALYNGSKPQGMGFVQYDPKPMSAAEAKTLLEKKTNFGYLKGRIMNMDLSGDYLDPLGYNRDNGEGAAEKVINELRTSKRVNTAAIATMHEKSTLAEAMLVEDSLRAETKIETRGAVRVMELGYEADVAGRLAPKLRGIVEEAVKKRRRQRN